MKKLNTNTNRELGQNGFIMPEQPWSVLSYDNDHMTIIAKNDALPLDFNRVKPVWATDGNYTVKKFSEVLMIAEGIINLTQHDQVAFLFERNGRKLEEAGLVNIIPEGSSRPLPTN